MGNLFGVRRRAPVVTAQDKAILQLKQQRDKIKICQRRTESELETSKKLALDLFQKNMKDRAIIVLRRKKFMEDIIARTDKQLETLEQLVCDIEYNQIQVSVVEGLKVGAEALKQLNNMFAIEDIQQIMEDTEEAAEKQKEISDILQQTSERYDEGELLKELQAYQTPAVKPAEPVLVKDIEPDEPAQEKKEHVEEEVVDVPAEPESVPEISDLNLDKLPNVPEETPDRSDRAPKRRLEPAQ